MMDKQVQPDTFKPPLHNIFPQIKQSLDKLLGIFKSKCVRDETIIGTTNLTKMQIYSGASESVSQKPYPIAMKHYDWVQNEINKLVDAKVIHSSHPSWSALIIIVPKGNGGKFLVISYRALNKVIWKFVWSMPKAEDIFSKLNSVHYFSPLFSALYIITYPLNEDSIPKTTFTSPFRKSEYLKVPFGLAQGPAYIQKFMNKVLKDLPFTIAYLDNIIIYSKAAEEHLDYLQQVFHNLCKAKLSMKLSKCHFFTKNINIWDMSSAHLP